MSDDLVDQSHCRLSHYAGVPVHISAYIVDTNTRDDHDDDEDNGAACGAGNDGTESDSGISDTNHDSDQVRIDLSEDSTLNMTNQKTQSIDQ